MDRVLNPNRLSKDDIDFVNDYFLVDTIEAPTDLALIFGAQYEATQNYMSKAAANLYLKGRFNHVAVSGGPVALGSTLSEAEEMADILRKNGIHSRNILIENDATNTQENVELVRDMVRNQKIAMPTNTVYCIGNAYGGRRILMTMKRRWPEVTAALKLFGPRLDFKQTWQDSIDDRRRLCHEFNKLAPYTKQGFLEEVNIRAINRKLSRINHKHTKN